MKQRIGLCAVLLLAGIALWSVPWQSHRTPAPVVLPSPQILNDADNPGGVVALPTGVKPQAPYARLVKTTFLAPARTKYLVLIVLDGARPDYFNVPGIPHLRALIRNGTEYTNAFAGILESETPSGHASIDTGSPPTGSGILSFAWANSDNTTVNLFDPANIRAGQMENIIKQAPAPSIAELVHRRDPSAKVVALGGHKYYANDALGGPQADAILYYMGSPGGQFAPVGMPGHMPPARVLQAPGLIAKSTSLPLGTEDHLAMRLARVSFNAMHERVMLLNMPEFDWPLGHNDGGPRDPAGVKTLMQGFDADLGKLEDLYRQAGILDQTVFVITADHGFAPIYHTIPKALITNAVAKAGTSIISDTYHTAGYIWLKDGTKGPPAARNIVRLKNPYIQSVYYKVLANHHYSFVRASSIKAFTTPAADAANQYLLGSFDGPDAPDVVIFFSEESASLPDGQASWKGDHGGADWESQHMPLVFSGPGVRKGVVSSHPARLEDIAPTALTLMGVSHAGMQGIPLADAIQRATPQERTQERTLGAHLRPVTRALRAEAAGEVAQKR
jgi:hypothetical protein